jgi:hypothetical protein
MEHYRYTVIEKYLNEHHSILEKKNELNLYFDNIPHNNKLEFLERLEYEYLTERKVELKGQKEFCKKNKFGAFEDLLNESIESYKFVVNWIIEKKGLLNTVIHKQKPEKTIFDYISNISNKESFALELKNTFNIESGIDFKIMIELLKEEEILTFTQFAPFFRSINSYFNREIGTQNGLNDLYKHSEYEKKYHMDRIIIIQNKLNPLITKYKIKQ